MIVVFILLFMAAYEVARQLNHASQGGTIGHLIWPLEQYAHSGMDWEDLFDIETDLTII